LSPFPVFATVLAAFTQRSAGPLAAQRLLRGVLLGSFGFASFFAVVTIGLVRWSLMRTYLVACLSALVVQVAIAGFLEARVTTYRDRHVLH
jgi:hypothetical protein